MNLYLEVYGLSLDPATGLGRFSARYSLMLGGKTLARIPADQVPPAPERDRRIRNSFRIKDIKPGDYVLRAGDHGWRVREFA
jgi:hypothetical protein